MTKAKYFADRNVNLIQKYNLYKVLSSVALNIYLFIYFFEIK